MSPILQPQQDFPIVRQIANHNDATLYYVEAVVRDADGVLIDRVQLVSQGDQRYQKRYRVPVDRSGAGAYISIVTSVYTDSGYTTKSPNYGDEENTYLIFDRLANRGGGSGGGNLDQGDIRRIIREELEKQKEIEDTEEKQKVEVPEPLEIPDYTPSLNLMLESMASIRELISKIPTEKVDTYPILEGIQNLAIAIDDKPVTPETNIGPIVESMQEIADGLGKELENEKKEMDNFKKELKEIIVEELNSIEFTQEIPVSKIGIKRAEKEPPKQYDLRKFVS